jgi:hypothetical protein
MTDARVPGASCGRPGAASPAACGGVASREAVECRVVGEGADRGESGDSDDSGAARLIDASDDGVPTDEAVSDEREAREKRERRVAMADSEGIEQVGTAYRRLSRPGRHTARRPPA